MYLMKEKLCGNAKSKFVLVKEDGTLKGLKIFKTVMKKLVNEKTKVAVLGYDGSINDLIFGVTECDNIIVFEEFVDPFGWIHGEGNKNKMSVDYIAEKFRDFHGLLCIYSLTSIMIQNDADKVYQTFHKLLNSEGFQILALVHSSVFDMRDNDKIERMATTVLHATSVSELSSVVHYSSGKVTSLCLNYNISDAFEFLSLSDIKLQKKTSSTKQPDPTANLTFNLRLKDEEKEAKDKLQLPYIKTQSSSIIVEDDLFDDEDPDDDLDI